MRRAVANEISFGIGKSAHRALSSGRVENEMGKSNQLRMAQGRRCACSGISEGLNS